MLVGDALTNYFTTTRTDVQIKRKFDDLEKMKKRDGSRMAARNDYKDRLGVTQPPMMQDSNALETLVFASPLAALMRSLRWVILLLYYLRSSAYRWTESKRKSAFTKAREEAKAAVQDATDIIMDAVDFALRGGNTDKGDVCRRLLKDYRHALVPHSYQEAYNDLLKGLLVAHTVYASPKKINEDHYKGLYNRTRNIDSLEYLITDMFVQAFE